MYVSVLIVENYRNRIILTFAKVSSETHLSTVTACQLQQFLFFENKDLAGLCIY